jgi:hypothetical protein
VNALRCDHALRGRGNDDDHAGIDRKGLAENIIDDPLGYSSTAAILAARTSAWTNGTGERKDAVLRTSMSGGDEQRDEERRGNDFP